MSQIGGSLKRVLYGVVLVAALGAVSVLAGCYTARGFGQDIESLGRYIQDTTQ